MQKKRTWIYMGAAFLACMIVRLVPFRAPNVEPLLSVQMPFAKRYGLVFGFLFGFTSIFLYDLITGKVGIWTLFTALAYGCLGIGSSVYFKKHDATRKQFILFAIMGTLFYDAMTGLTIGPLFFHENFSLAFFGQIPFTAMHLLGNILFAAILSPAMYRFLVYDRKRNHLPVQSKPISISLTTHSL